VSERTIYLEDVAVEVARARFDEALAQAGLRNDRRETLVLDDALGRVTAAPAFARLSSPHYHACAMDGVAVNAKRTRGARA
jgi:putative molybdopterin biosynthesis protein